MPILDLSLTEERIVRLILEGRSATEIATEQGIDLQLVEWYAHRALRKLASTSALHASLSRALDIGPQNGKEDS